jgi:hypothetical protein
LSVFHFPGCHIMKGITLTQPWASLVALGAKKIETRPWSTRYRGSVAIHAATGFPKWAQECCHEALFQRHLGRNEASQFYVGDLIRSLPVGAVIAVAEIAACLPTDSGRLLMSAASLEFRNGRWRGDVSTIVDYVKPQPNTPEHAFGDYSPGRYMWFLENVQALPKLVPCRGALGLWEVPDDVERVINEQIDF